MSVTPRRSTHVPTVGGVAVTDLSSVLGGVVWVVTVGAGTLGVVERALALAPLVLVPLGIGMTGIENRWLRTAVWLQPLGAIGFVASLSLSIESPIAAALATLWIVVTGLLGVAGVERTVSRGGVALPETAIDAGLAYVSVGAVAVVLYHLDVTFWFSRTIILLTGVHFHYAGFVLPLIVGLTGRCRERRSRATTALVWVILAGPAIIAVGISFSPLVEVIAVGGFTAAVALFGADVVVRITPTRPPRQAVFLGISAVALPVSMALALGYGIATFTGLSVGLDISTMVTIHGSLNAFGFALIGLVGWRLAVPSQPTTTAD